MGAADVRSKQARTAGGYTSRMQWWFRFWVRWWLWVSRSLMWVGVILLVLAVGFWLPRWLWSRSMQHATGTVTETEARQDVQGNVAYFPHFRFRLPDGEIVQVVSAKGGDESTFSADEVVPVVYKAGDPQGAELAPAKQVYRTAIALAITGTVLLDIGAGLWIKRRRRERRAL